MRLTLVSCAALALIGSSARAQCADGSPPPCGRQVAAAPRAPNPPLDDRTWIVMPFDNVTNASDVDWLREASVNLLYLDMSRWQDIRVVDDERVADLLRDTPGARGTTMSLAPALAAARRAGAGRLVMGDVIKSGNRTMLTAKVFNVRDGQRTATVHEETTVQDSVIPLFGKLARKILKVDPPAGSSVGMVGTTKIGAYQAYSRGVQALNRFDIALAKQELRRALQLDTAFALAHYKLATALGWFEGSDPTRREHAEASGRYSNSLPQRERALIAAQLWHIRGDPAKGRDLYLSLIKADSLDVEAWHGLGETVYHDFPLLRDANDTTRARFRGDWNVAARAFEKVLALDPTYHVAFPHLIDMHMQPMRNSCVFDAEFRCVEHYTAIVRVSGDSVAIAPVRTLRDSAMLRQQWQEYIRQGGRRPALARADRVSIRWLGAAPNENYALQSRARLLSALGRVTEAKAMLDRMGPPENDIELAGKLAGRIELALKTVDFKEAHRIYDSVRTTPTTIKLTFTQAGPTAPTTISPGDWLARQFGWTFGRFADADTALRGFGGQSPGPLVMRSRRGFARLMAGLPDSIADAQRTQFEDVASRTGAAAATRNVVASLSFGLNVPRISALPLDTSLNDLRLQPVFALMRNDTGRLRALAQVFDSTSRALTGALLHDTAFALVAAETYLAARDSLAALRTLRRMLDTTLVTSELFAPISASGTVGYTATLPRVALLRADLAAALGERAEALLWYRKVLDLWASADAELAPVVARVRRAVAAPSG